MQCYLMSEEREMVNYELDDKWESYSVMSRVWDKENLNPRWELNHDHEGCGGVGSIPVGDSDVLYPTLMT